MDDADFLARSVRDRPHAVALAGGGGRWTFRELAAAADAVAGGMELPPRVPAALVLPPSPEAIIALHGVLRAGALAAPLHPRLTGRELAEAVATLRPPVVLTTPELAGRVTVAVATAGGPEPGVSVSKLPGTFPGLVALAPRWKEPPPVPGVEGAAAVLWTSGTTRRPRGIVLTASALRHSAEASRERLELHAEDRWYASLSVAHVGGVALVVRAALIGSGLVARGAFDTADLAHLAESGAVSHASLVPVMLRRLMDLRGELRGPRSLQCLLVGGGPAPRALVERALELGYPVALTYGLTEATSQVATAPPDLVALKPGTVGPPLPGVEVRIDEGGEILVRGPTLAGCALGSGGAARGALPVDAEGWLHTGDLGAMDGDGHLRVTGRRSQRIVSGGVTVDPGEVEAVLESHPAVREAAVVGVADSEWGERVVAAVVLRTGSAGVLGEVDAFCRERLTSAKVPRRLVVLPALLRNPNGKIDRRATRALLEQGELVPSRAELPPEKA